MLNRSTVAYCLKNLLRNIEAALTPARCRVTFRDEGFTFVRTVWRDESSQASFDEHIAPYFDLPVPRSPRCILDAGAAAGCFSIAAARKFTEARILAFEPSRRQRILARRNVLINGVGNRITVVPAALWNSNGRMPFRSQGHASSLMEAATASDTCLFPERIRVVKADDWIDENCAGPVDIVKMDIEGAEIEALEGMRRIVSSSHPVMLVQAYHTRDGTRTFERCAAFLSSFGYNVKEIGNSGQLVGVHREGPETA